VEAVNGSALLFVKLRFWKFIVLEVVRTAAQTLMSAPPSTFTTLLPAQAVDITLSHKGSRMDAVSLALQAFCRL
jgi:hypothetical protein